MKKTRAGTYSRPRPYHVDNDHRAGHLDPTNLSQASRFFLSLLGVRRLDELDQPELPL